MSYAPKNFEWMNQYQGLYNPSTVHTTNNAETWFFERALWQRIYSVFEWTIPKNWDLDYWQGVLANLGYCAIISTPEYGVIPQFGTLSGYGIYYQPTHININTPLIHMDNLRIDEDCAVVKFTPDYMGIWDIVHHYAEKLALCSSAIDMNLINSRVAYFIGVKNKNASEAFKKMLDNVNSGNPYSFFDYKGNGGANGEEPFYTYDRNVKQSYVGDLLHDEYRSILNEFDTEIGIPSANTDKRERLIDSEVNANNVETASRVSVWIDSMKHGIDKANEMYNIGLSVKLRFPEVITSGKNYIVGNE